MIHFLKKERYHNRQGSNTAKRPLEALGSPHSRTNRLAQSRRNTIFPNDPRPDELIDYALRRLYRQPTGRCLLGSCIEPAGARDRLWFASLLYPW